MHTTTYSPSLLQITASFRSKAPKKCIFFLPSPLRYYTYQNNTIPPTRKHTAIPAAIATSVPHCCCVRNLYRERFPPINFVIFKEIFLISSVEEADITSFTALSSSSTDTTFDCWCRQLFSRARGHRTWRNSQSEHCCTSPRILKPHKPHISKWSLMSCLGTHLFLRMAQVSPLSWGEKTVFIHHSPQNKNSTTTTQSKTTKHTY